MASLSYSFCMSMLHSFWQAGILLLMYVVINKLFLQKSASLEKRNFLYVAIGTQLILSVLTFFIYYINTTNNVAEHSLNALVAPLLSADITHTVAPWFFGAYIAVILFKTLKAIYSWQRFKQYYKAGLQKPDIELKLFTKVKAYHLGIKREVKLWLSTNISTPVTFGFFKPVILLPVSLVNRINMQQAETLILHELSHIRINDYLLNWFLVAAETIFFFNPFVLSFCKAIRMEREKYCDTTVIEFNYPATLYAETLLQAERIKQLIPGFQLAAVSKKKQLLQRIQFFTDERNFTGRKQNRFIVPLLSAVMLIVFTASLFFQLPVSPKDTFATAAALPAVVDEPVADTEIPAVIKTASLQEEISKNAEKIADVVIKSQPMVEKKLKALQPLLESIQQNAATIAENAQQDFAMPVVQTENDVPVQQMVVKEEQSGSKSSSVKVYQLRVVNGQWVVQPEWMASARDKFADSVRKALDTGAGANVRVLTTQ
jgi:beta-lactamase regulating signal transducer with metallopeptidase domain